MELVIDTGHGWFAYGANSNLVNEFFDENRAVNDNYLLTSRLAVA